MYRRISPHPGSHPCETQVAEDALCPNPATVRQDYAAYPDGSHHLGSHYRCDDHAAALADPDDDDAAICPSCNGEGETRDDAASLAVGIDFMARCDACGGTGEQPHPTWTYIAPSSPTVDQSGPIPF